MSTHGLGNLEAVSALALRAGLDMDMVSEGLLSTLAKSLKEGKVTNKQIDQACRRILEAKYKLGLFQDPYKFINEARPKAAMMTHAALEVSREAGRKSIVLLKNAQQLLPLKSGIDIALIGPLASDRSNMLGTWMVSADPQKSVPIVQGFIELGGREHINYAKGSNISNDTNLIKRVNVFGTRIDSDARSNKEMIAEAVKIAAKAEVTVAVIGEASEMSGEDACRTNLHIPQEQIQLLQEIRKVTNKLVVIVMAGRPLILTDVAPLADALLFTGHPGTQAGYAIADVVFGRHNPSAKLTMTFPRNMGQIPIYYAQLPTGRPQPTDAFQKFLSNYIDSENTPYYPFGYGLSYTSFVYSNLTLSSERVSPSANLTASVTLTNTGLYDGDEVVQLYLRDPEAQVSRPVKELKGFQRVNLKKGESKIVSFTITPEMLKYYNSDLKWVMDPGTFEVMIGGSSDQFLSKSFEVVGKSK
jgi:beta-glucosidase